MAYNKTKHVETAQKYLHQGKIAQAIGEYLAVLKHDSRDQITLMTVGDLYVRQGETFQALEYFERLAQIFLAEGFVTKAIAIYKKITKLAPEETRPVERLADLYLQQGVLSEARPIYLQLAELHQRAGRQPQAAGLLRKLLEAEPENLRVQTRLAALLTVMGQSAEAAATYRVAAEQLHRRGDHAEALKQIDHSLQIDAGSVPAATLKARILSSAGQRDDAVALLKSLPQIDSGGEAADSLLNLYLEAGENDAAVELAEKIFAHNPKHYAPAHRLAATLLDTAEPERALPLMDLIREAMTDGGEHEALSQSLMLATEKLPSRIEPREWLVELYGRTSDSFRLPDALANLGEAYSAAGQPERARQTYEQLLDRDPENEVARHKYDRLRAGSGIGSEAVEALPPVEARAHTTPNPSELPLDEETQRFVTQSLTDVDLFSSYGLTQKAIDLLEVVLQRAPRDTPSIERLLDLYLGAGDEQRTAELAAQLQEIHTQRGDSGAAERFADLRRRFERAAGRESVETAPAAPPPEFAVPVVDAEPIAEPEPVPIVEIAATAQDFAADPTVHEVDLSEEWAALAGDLMAATAEPMETAVVPEGNASADAPEYSLEIEAAPVTNGSGTVALNADEFLRSLSSELDSVLPALNAVETLGAAPGANDREPLDSTPPAAHAVASTTQPSSPLDDVFDEFRANVGELPAENEDLETHYNLGIAYREMGLIEEAISEFQRVAKANNQGQAFRYAMQCCTLLGLAFMEKGQPAIAVMWYERALVTPGLDQESILALRYDLGIAQELAGDTTAARNSFSQVYGMNIDYRDVAERLGALGKGT